jgi:hypothetical protein
VLFTAGRKYWEAGCLIKKMFIGLTVLEAESPRSGDSLDSVSGETLMADGITEGARGRGRSHDKTGGQGEEWPSCSLTTTPSGGPTGGPRRTASVPSKSSTRDDRVTLHHPPRHMLGPIFAHVSSGEHIETTARHSQTQ